jgi:hypothetical protein
MNTTECPNYKGSWRGTKWALARMLGLSKRWCFGLALGDAVRGESEGEAQKFNSRIQVGGLAEINADPAAVGKDVMGFGAAGCDELVADVFRKGNVHETIAVDVADFASAETILCAAEAVGLRRDSGTSMQGGSDFFFCS